jgi:hypothetical protein
METTLSATDVTSATLFDLRSKSNRMMDGFLKGMQAILYNDTEDFSAGASWAVK